VDLYKDVAKVLPALPQGQGPKGFFVGPGKTNSPRNKTRQRNGPLFQSFTLDSVFTDRRASRMALSPGGSPMGSRSNRPTLPGVLATSPLKAAARRCPSEYQRQDARKGVNTFQRPVDPAGKISISWKEDIELTREKVKLNLWM